MNFFKRLGDWLGISPPKQKPSVLTVADLIDLGREARYAENFANALDIFEQSVALAQARQDSTALAIARLNIADTYIQMERYDDAETLLTDLEVDTEKRQHHTPLAYTLCLRGYLYQMRENWEKARDYYNQALAIAEKANATGAIGRARGHLADTYLREGNATYAEHLLKEALPLLDETNDVELTSHFIGQYALTMIQLGRDNDGDRLLETALQRAQRLHFTTQIRHWQRMLGERRLNTGDYQAAFQHYHEFLQLSPDPLPQTEEYGLILSNLSEITRHLGQQDEALDYALQAEKILSNVESNALSSQALTAIGLAMRANKQFEDALGYFQRALDTTQPADDDRLTIHLEIAQTHVTAGDYAKAETAYSDLIDQLNEDTQAEDLARANTGLGTAYHKQHKLEQAIQQWMSAYKIYEEQGNHNQTARVICDIAQARYELGDGKRAISDYERALMLLNSVDMETRGIVMANAAIAYADKGDVPTTESFFTEAIDIARELKNTNAEALRRNNYAAYLVDIGHAQRAIVSLEHSLKLVSKTDNPLHNAIFRSNTGVAYRALEDYHKAGSYHQQANDIFAPLEPSRWITLNNLYLTEVYLDTEQLELAESCLPHVDTDDIDVHIQYHLTSAHLFLLQDKLEQAATAIDHAIAQAQSTYRQRLLARSLMMQSRIQAKHDDKDTAVETWQSAEKLLKLLQMPIPNPNWLHVPSSDG